MLQELLPKYNKETRREDPLKEPCNTNPIFTDHNLTDLKTDNTTNNMLNGESKQGLKAQALNDFPAKHPSAGITRGTDSTLIFLTHLAYLGT